ncbi:hypothetical protein D9619_007615 [Psilocybe cf. subviscida]|uniref:Uncharacterized protein n=1 Tax=Psilocybe cf. subviscida TaxID=2480587 RepID=A0A8H5B1Q3_9AGAR|nr:hypothetical protein D9619_007615 [Psilocybe cf. subviscida]
MSSSIERLDEEWHRLLANGSRFCHIPEKGKFGRELVETFCPLGDSHNRLVWFCGIFTPCHVSTTGDGDDNKKSR